MWPAPVELWGPGSREVVGEDLGPRVREALAWPSRVSTLRVQFAPLFFILMRVERSRRRSWSSRVALVEGGSTAAILAVILPETSSWKAAGPVEREEGESSCRSAGCETGGFTGEFILMMSMVFPKDPPRTTCLCSLCP